MIKTIALLTGIVVVATAFGGKLPEDLMFFISPELRVPLVAEEFLIDGQIEPREAASCAAGSTFIGFGVNPLPDDSTMAFMACTRDYLYIALRTIAPDGKGAQSVSTQRDEAGLWTRDDAVEVQGTVNGADYNFIGNFAGVKGDRKGGKAAWNDEDWKFAARHRDRIWECEFMLPAKTFGLTGFKPGDTFQFDVFNNKRSSFQSGLAFRAGRWHFPRTYWPRFTIGRPGAPCQRTAMAGELGGKRIGLKLDIANPSSIPEKIRIWAAFYKALPDKEENYFSQISGLYNDKEVALKPGATKNELAHHVLKPLLRDNYVLTEVVDREEEVAPGATLPLEIRKPALPGNYLAAYRISDASGGVVGAWVLPVVRNAPLAARLDYYYTTGKCIVANIKMPLSSPPERIVCRIMDRGRVVTEAAVTAGKPGETLSLPLSTAEMKPGKYVLMVEGLRNGVQENSFMMEFENPEDPAWLDSNAGKGNFVPRPWTPVQAQSGKVAVWGREFTWDNTLFPASIRSQGGELLAAPLTLEAVANGEKVIWKDQRASLMSHDDGHALYSLAAESKLLRLEGTLRVEYDGMARFDLKLESKSKVRLDALSFDVPVRGEVAKYFKRDENLGLQSRNMVSGEWEKKFPDWSLLGGKSWVMPFTPALVLRNDRTGLEWFAESDRDWNNISEEAKIGIISGNGRETIRIMFVDKPLEMSRPLSYTFGLMPWPVRPWPEKRSHVSQYLGRMDTKEYETFRRKPLSEYWLYDHDLHRLLGRDEDAIRANIARGKQLGMDVLWVFHWNHYRDPEGKFYHPCEHMELFNGHMRKRVERLGALAKEAQVKIMGHVGYGVAPTNHDFKYYSHELASHPIDNKGAWGYKYSPAGCMRDLYSHRAREFAEKYNWSGIQLDGTYMLRYDDCEYTGAGWRDANGRLRGRFPVFALRELAQRIYKVYHGEVKLPTVDSEGFVYVHTDGYSCGAVVSSADAIHCGEEPLSMNVKHLDQLDFIREWVRYPAQALGIPFDWLPKMGSAPVGNAGRIAIALQLGMGMPAYQVLDGAKTHDYRRMSCPVDRLWAAFDWVGADNHNFIRADKIHDYIKASDPKIMTALYVAQKGALLAVTNLKREKNEVELTCLPKKLGIDPERMDAKDAITGEALPCTAGKLRLQIDADSYRLVKLFSREAKP